MVENHKHKFQLYFVTINFSSLFAFGYDKFQSKLKIRNRIPEKRLLLITSLGGFIGSLLGIKLFKHKIKKLKFLYKIYFISLVDITLLIYYKDKLF